MTDFSKKGDIFNSLFAKQYSVIENNSVFASSTDPIIDQYLADNKLTEDDINRIICKRDPNKAPGHDIISICMLKISGDAIIEPLFRIFKNWLICEIFLDDWKKGNIVPIFKKGDKRDIKNYRPVSIVYRERILTYNIWDFLRPNLDYEDVIYDRAFNESFQNKLKSVQYNTALTITGAIRGSSREKLYQKVGLESLKL